MAFKNTIEKVLQCTTGKVVSGNYESDGGSTGGEIETGLTNVYAIFLQPKGSAILANQPVVNETFPVSGGYITIITTANEIGTYIAIGE